MFVAVFENVLAVVVAVFEAVFENVLAVVVAVLVAVLPVGLDLISP